MHVDVKEKQYKEVVINIKAKRYGWNTVVYTCSFEYFGDPYVYRAYDEEAALRLAEKQINRLRWIEGRIDRYAWDMFYAD